MRELFPKEYLAAPLGKLSNMKSHYQSPLLATSFLPISFNVTSRETGAAEAEKGRTTWLSLHMLSLVYKLLIYYISFFFL